MDFMYRKEDLSEQQDKLKQVSGLEQPLVMDQNLSPISPPTKKLQTIIDEIRDIDQKRYGYFRYVLLGVLLLIAGIWYVMKGGAVLDILMIALSYIIYIWVAHRLIRLLRARKKLEHGDRFLPMVITEDMDHQVTIERTYAVMELGKRRLLLVSLCYMIFFPVLLVLGYSIWLSSSELTPHYTWAWIGSIATSAIGWYMYDNRFIDRSDSYIDNLHRLVW